MVYQVFKKNDLCAKFHISTECLYNFSKEISLGYFKENPFHNVQHIIDSLQAMHYFFENGNLNS